LAYVNSLKVCEKYYLNPLIVLISNNKPILSDVEVKSIFGFIEIITKFHIKLYDRLKERIGKSFTATTEISDIFNDFWNEGAPKIYTRYIQSFDEAMRTLAHCGSTNPTFKSYLSKTKSASEVKDLDLLAYLVMPVQRIPRYIMLLDDLLKHTSATHPDYNGLEKAIETTKEVTVTINEKKRELENTQRILLIQESLGNAENLVAPNRTFLLDGSFLEVKKGGSKYRYLFLFNDLLVVSQQNKKKFEYKQSIPLLDVAEISDIPDSKTLKNAFKVVFKDKDKKKKQKT